MDRARLKKRIEGYEGRKYEAYDDTEGYRTVAVGYCLDDPGAKSAIEALNLDFDLVYAAKVAIGDRHCDALLDNSLDVAIADAKAWVSNFVEHPDDVQEAIVDMSYNLGLPRLAKFVNAHAAFEAKDYCAAAREMGNSKWATQVGRRAQDDIAIVQAHCA